jgi:hypothetical protein
MSRPQRFALEFASQALLALAVGTLVSLVLAGTVLLLASTAHAAGGAPALHESAVRLGRGRVRVSPARERRGRSPSDARGRARDRGRDPRAPGRQGELRAGQARGAALPTNLPEGWNYEAVFGELPRGATDSRFDLLAGLLLVLTALGLYRRFA